MRAQPEAWTIGALHDHLERRFRDLEKLVDVRFDAQEKATKAALVSAEKAVEKAEKLATSRAEQQNEWRQTVTDLTRMMMPRAEFDTAHGNLVDRMTGLCERMDRAEGRTGQTHTIIPWLIAAAGVIVAVISFIVGFTY